MFTGIVEETGRVHSIRPAAAAIELWVQARVCARGLKAGDSVAVNGCCLTVETTKARGKDKLLKFALLKETWNRTNLQFVQPGAGVNLERVARGGPHGRAFCHRPHRRLGKDHALGTDG